MTNEIKTWEPLRKWAKAAARGETDKIPYIDIVTLIDENAELRAKVESLAADAERWQSILKLIIQEMPKRTHYSLGNAPGHAHQHPGIWDSDNGIIAGKECAWCKAWNSAIDAMAKEKA